MDNENSQQNEAMDASKLGSDSTRLQSVSTSSDPAAGFAVTNDHLRSVLMHPMGLPLVFYLNDALNKLTANQRDCVQSQLKYVQTAFDNFTSCDDISSLRDNVFAATVLDWQGGETELTEKLMFNMMQCKLGDPLLTMDREKYIVGNGDNRKGIVDFIVRKETSIVAMFEFGLDNSIWWTKQDQILKYVKILRTNVDPNYKIDQPMLLSVITINKVGKKIEKRKIGDDGKESEKEKLSETERNDILRSNLKKITSNEIDLEQVTLQARFGVFLCMPKGTNNEFRIALLWRHSAKTLKDASTQFGRLLNAVQFCSFLREHCTLHEDAIKYKYLGPNCCKIGDLVRVNFLSY